METKNAKRAAGRKAASKPERKAARKTVSKPGRKAGRETVPEQGKMKVSSRGALLVAKYEGCQLRAYKCPAGVWTIGFGHTAGVRPGQVITKDKALELLRTDLRRYGEYVNGCVRRGKIGFTLTQNMFDALTSFTYNCGPGNLERLVTGNSARTVADKLLLYNKGGGRILPGLVRRRQEERKLFLKGR